MNKNSDSVVARQAAFTVPYDPHSAPRHGLRAPDLDAPAASDN
jgi:hypothetical protein